MSDAGVSLKVDDSAVLGALSRLIAAGGNVQGVLKDIGERLVPSTKARFVSQTSPDGVPWKPVNPDYAKEKEEQGFGSSILTRGRDLRDGIHSQVDASSVEVGSNKIYARIHQLGGTIKPKADRKTENGRPAALVFSIGGRIVKRASVTIPARPFLGLSADDREEIEAIIETWLADALAGS